MFRKVIRNALFIITLLLFFNRLAAQVQPVRVCYAVKDSQSLWFDDYRPAGKSNGITVLFVHGGSFTGGAPKNQKPMADGLNQLGYRVLVMKYRLYLKGRNFGCGIETPEKLRAIQYAVEDVVDAVNYVADHGAELAIDCKRLFLSGSSAGAEAVLNTVYNPFKPQKNPAFQKFATIRLAGIMAFSGALLDPNAMNEKNWVPTLLMHGVNDQLVPYNVASHHYCNAADKGWVMMFGSRSIYELAFSKNWPVMLYSYADAGHEVSNFMFRKFREMDDFMQTAVKNIIKPKEYLQRKGAEEKHIQ